MKRHSKLKKQVLRSVYEDNAGIPRSCLGKGRPKPVPELQAPDPRPGYRNRVALVVLLGLVALFGINFRLVTVDATGPVAMQMPDKAPRQAWSVPIPVTAGGGAVLPASSEPARVTEPVRVVNDASITSGGYGNMLASLGMPMADLFDLEVRTIVIDPGHGGIDPGATGRQGLMEKDVALDIARRLRDKLESAGNYRVVLTREQDRKVYLKERVAFAKDNHADLFISIHINSLPVEDVNYVETYYFGPHTDQRSLELAQQENRDSDYAMGDFREVIAKIGDTMKTEESKQLADAIHHQLYSSLKRRNRGLVDAGSKAGPFVVLLGVDVPSVLVEVSCISNKAEETRLSKPHYRDDVAGFLKAGIVQYLQRRGYRRSAEGGKIQHVAKQER